MQIQENISLALYTTFKIGGTAKFFCLIKNEDDIKKALDFAKEKNITYFFLGGGSNLLVADKGYDGLVIKSELKGTSFENDFVTAFSGEDWDSFVEICIQNGYYGLENLSLIPGTVGASPVQNIGAYGVEVGSLIEKVRVYDTRNEVFTDLSNRDCLFGYRDSIFKNQKGRFFVISVTYRLNRKFIANIEYKDLKNYFGGKEVVNAKEVREAVVSIRKNKLPDWKEWGTAGSFFKNPIIPIKQYLELKQKYPELPGFPDCDGNIKVSLAWILDKVCDVKKLTFGNVFIYEKQALVIVAKPNSKAEEVMALSQKIQNLVLEKTGLTIEAEVEWVN
jgi:UDP-N-acetylmuramate dehydrogenase